MNDFICYCFEYTRDDITQDVVKNGQSLIWMHQLTEYQNDHEHYRTGEGLVEGLATAMKKLL